MKKFAKSLLSIVSSIVLMFAGQAAMASPAVAEVTLKDVQTIVRTVGFLENMSGSDAVMAIIYNPGDRQSRQDARRMENLINNDMSNMEARLVSVSNMSALSGADLAFVMSGLGPYYDSIRGALNNNKVLSFSQDRSCVDQSCCAVYINSEGRVDIVVNKTVVDKLQAKFKPVFLMMVTVI